MLNFWPFSPPPKKKKKKKKNDGFRQIIHKALGIHKTKKTKNKQNLEEIIFVLTIYQNYTLALTHL